MYSKLIPWYLHNCSFPDSCPLQVITRYREQLVPWAVQSVFAVHLFHIESCVSVNPKLFIYTPPFPFGSHKFSFLCLWVSFCFVNKLVCIVFLDFTCKWYHVKCVFLWLTSLSVIIRGTQGSPVKRRELVIGLRAGKRVDMGSPNKWRVFLTFLMIRMIWGRVPHMVLGSSHAVPLNSLQSSITELSLSKGFRVRDTWISVPHLPAPSWWIVETVSQSVYPWVYSFMDERL